MLLNDALIRFFKVLPAKVTLVADPETVLATISREAVVEEEPAEEAAADEASESEAE